MQFGHFDDRRREYVITTPETPYPWINYLGTEAFFSLVSHTGGGYSFYRDARLRRITRYRYNSVPLDDTGKRFYIHDEGDIWSPGYQPVRAELEHYECRHGLGYTLLRGRRGGVEAEVLSLVPLETDGEVQRVRLTNRSDRPKRLHLFSFVEFCLWNALDDMTNFQRNLSTGEVEVHDGLIVHKTEFRERRNHYAFYAVNRAVAGFDTDRDRFLGPYNGFDRPQVVLEAQSRDSIAHGWSPIASHHLAVTLAPGDSETFVFLLGYVELPEAEKFVGPERVNLAPARAMMDRFAEPRAVDAAMERLGIFWDDLLGRFQLQSDDERLNRMVNIWNPYQCMVTFCLSRSASYFESGIGRGMGFRDSNQDLLGFVHQIPAKARRRLLDLAATQFEDGGAYHQYQPLTRRGNDAIGGDFYDDPLWLIQGVTTYVKETGDFGILDEPVPYDHDPERAQPLWDHLRRSFDHVVNHLGPHGLPLIGRADWNDCLNLNCYSTNPDESFQTTVNRQSGVAESVFIAAMFLLYGGEYHRLCQRLGLTAEAERARGHLDAMRRAVDDHGWDGRWFLRAYDAQGRPIGSQANTEGRIFIEPQGFCVMAGVGLQDGRARQALDAVQEHLECPYGIVLNAPAYRRYHLELGEISSYPPGYKENGGIFCHNNPWIMIAETRLGRGDRAFELYRKIAPAYLESISDLHRTEPYVYAQMIAGKEAPKPGEAKNSWLTGTAAWNYVAVTQYILGIRPDYDGLIIDPCIPSTWPGYTVTRRFRGATYRIRVRNPRHVCRGIARIRFNDKPLASNRLPVEPGTHRVEVTLGEPSQS